jgi:hypothetical protein
MPDELLARVLEQRKHNIPGKSRPLSINATHNSRPFSHGSTYAILSLLQGSFRFLKFTLEHLHRLVMLLIHCPCGKPSLSGVCRFSKRTSSSLSLSTGSLQFSCLFSLFQFSLGLRRLVYG